MTFLLKDFKKPNQDHDRQLSKKRSEALLSVFGRFIPFGDPCEAPHETVLCDDIPVDRRIASLILFLWSKQIETHNSCEGDPRLDEKAYSVAPNFYSGCYSATVTFGSFNEAEVILKTLTAVLKALHGSGEEHQVFMRSDASGYFHVMFPSKMLREKEFMNVFKERFVGFNEKREIK